jgi:hypothetical protein
MFFTRHVRPSKFTRNTTPKRSRRPRPELRIELLEDRMVPANLIPVSGAHALVYDYGRGILDITTANGSVAQFNVKTQSLLPPVHVGMNLAGADLTTDASALIMADQGGPPGGEVVYRLDLNSLNPVAYFGPLFQQSTGAWGLTLGPNNVGLFDDSATAGGVQMQQINGLNGQITWRQDAPGSLGPGVIGSKSILSRSADRSVILIADTGSSPGRLFTYNTQTGTFSAPVSTGVSLAGALTAVNRNGTLFAVEVNGVTTIYDRYFNIIQRFNGLDGGMTFDPNQDVFYVAQSNSQQVLAFDTNTWSVRYPLQIGETVPRGTPMGTGTMAVNNDSTWLFMTTSSGVREIPLPPFIGQAVSFVFSNVPSSTQAGAPLSLTVTAVDSKGHVVPNYTGKVHFTSSDRRASLPPDYTFTGFDQGSHTFVQPPAFLVTAGIQTVTAVDTQNANLRGTFGLQVVPGPAWSYGVSYGGYGGTSAGAPPVPAGYDLKPTVTAYDMYNNVVTNYTGTIHLSSSDPAAQLSPDYTFTAADKGTHQFSVTLFTTGSQSFTFTDKANSSLKQTVNVTVGNFIPGLHFAVTPATLTPTAGTAFGLTVTALDMYNQVATRYVGTVTFSSSDAGAVLPADYTYTAADAGVHTFPITLVTAGTRSVSFRDTTFITGAGIVTTNFTVSPAAASTFQVAGFPSGTAGAGGSFTVTAYDPYGNVATGYGGTVHFSSSDAQANLPADATLTSGTGTFSATLKTAGTQLLTATDTANANLTGTEAGITISPAAASTLQVGGFPAGMAGTSGNFNVTAYDPFGNVATSYNGTVHFCSSDARASLPADATLTSGTGTFSATLKTTGAQSLTATDTANVSLSGTEGGIAVSPAAASSLLVTGFPSSVTAGVSGTFTVTAYDAFGNVATGYNGTVHFSSSDPQANLTADATLTNGTGTFSATLKTAGAQSLTAADTANASLSGTESGIAVSAAAASVLVLSAPSSVTAGVAFTFTVTLLDAYGNVATGYVGTVHFSSSDALAGLPPDYTFTPADAGSATFTGTLNTTDIQTLTAEDDLDGLSATLAVLVLAP